MNSRDLGSNLILRLRQVRLLKPFFSSLGSLRRWIDFLYTRSFRNWRNRLRAYLLFRRGRSQYVWLTESQLKASRKSDTVFVLGSGSSINDIPESQWRWIEKHDTFSFSEFARCDKVRVDYHLLTEALDVENVAGLMREHSKYQNTLFAAQSGWGAEVANEMLGRGLIRPGARIFPFKRYRRPYYTDLAPSFRVGVAHMHNTVTSVTNFCALAGWKRIVFVGVDLYDKRYFFLPGTVTREKEPPGVTYQSVFPSSERLLEVMAKWKPTLEKWGVQVQMFNPRSRLTAVFPVFDLKEMDQ